MADPDWIGPPVEEAWWSSDGREVLYTLKRPGSPVRDMYRQNPSGSAAAKVADGERVTTVSADVVYDAPGRRGLMLRHDDVFVVEADGHLRQLTRTNASESVPGFSADGGVFWRVDDTWLAWDPNERSTREVAVLAAEKPPDAEPAADFLREQQFRVLATLRQDREEKQVLRRQDEVWREADSSRAPEPIYLGDEVVIHDSSLSPDLRYLLVVTLQKDAKEEPPGQMPEYVTESGYEEFRNVRTRVGRNPPLPQKLWLVDLRTRQVRPVSFDALPGIDRDPLASLRRAARLEPLSGSRAVEVGDGGSVGIEWTRDGRGVAVMLRAIDNKDRWIATVDLDTARLKPRHRLQDPAWINWNFNDFGWLPDNRTLWYLSEESGYSHLYTIEGEARPRQRTAGRWEASMPQLGRDGRSFYFLCNRRWPGDYEVCGLNLDDDSIRELTDLDGVEDFRLSPDGSRLLVRYSGSYLPPQLAVADVTGIPSIQRLTDTRSGAFKSRDWIRPEYVRIPSRHGTGAIWGKYYGPVAMEPGKRYPVVMFVHGAGYLQNVSERYPNYFREQMFHNLLVQRGYVVLDLDFRASEGYGREWRTAIYRNMGHPELEDYLDGLDWLVTNKQADRDRAGIYGGSYGGFLTYMALFRAPGAFKAGAALRPVADWSQYNHPYTANILNTPDVDPEAYRVSSAIGYADGLQDHLLIAHGMIDDNVFFRDSVMLTQKLIELHKDNWQVAPYPLERHSFTRADSWLDEYRRILDLFEKTLK